MCCVKKVHYFPVSFHLLVLIISWCRIAQYDSVLHRSAAVCILHKSCQCIHFSVHRHYRAMFSSMRYSLRLPLMLTSSSSAALYHKLQFYLSILFLEKVIICINVILRSLHWEMSPIFSRYKNSFTFSDIACFLLRVSETYVNIRN